MRHWCSLLSTMKDQGNLLPFFTWETAINCHGPLPVLARSSFGCIVDHPNGTSTAV